MLAINCTHGKRKYDKNWKQTICEMTKVAPLEGTRGLERDVVDECLGDQVGAIS